MAWNSSLPMLLVRLSDSLTREQFEAFKPDIRKAEGQTDKTKMVTVTMKADPTRGFVDRNGRPLDFVSRFFAPWIGIDEDSVCGNLILIYYIKHIYISYQLYLSFLL